MHVQGTDETTTKTRHHPTLGANLYWWRLTRRLSHRELAQRAAVAYRSIGAWEDSVQDPTYDQALRLAKALEIPVQYFWDHLHPPLSDPPPLDAGRKSNRRVKVQETCT